MAIDRKVYMRNYYEANKSKLKIYMRDYYEANKLRCAEERKKQRLQGQPRSPSALAAEARYREKKRMLKEIAEMPVPTIDGSMDSA